MTCPLRRFVFLAVPLALAALLSSAATAQTPTPNSAFRIAGRVVNAITGERVPGATVTLLDEKGNRLLASVVADSEGDFTLNNIPAGKYPLNASKRGYRSAFYDEHEGFNTAIVTGEGQNTENLVFQLTPGALLRGVVTAGEGDPVPGASVMLFQRPDPGASVQRVQQVGNVNTDDSGAYEFGNLAPGEYMVAVKAQPWYARHPAGDTPSFAPPNPLDVAYPITYFDSTTDEASATPISLSAGSREEADIVLHAVPAIRLSVPLPRLSNGRFSSAELRQSVFGNQISAQVSPATNGREASRSMVFTGLAPGPYELQQGDPPRILQLNASASGEVDGSAGTPTLPVSGTLRSSGPSPLPDLVNLVLAPFEGSREALQTTAHNAQFQFDAVPPGLWTLSASPAGGEQQSLSVVAISAAGAVSAGNRFTVRDRPLSIVATLSHATTRVQGFARINGKPAPGVMVVLVPRDPSAYPSLARRDQSDSDGSFSLPDVPAGRYSVIAIDDGWKLDWQNRDVIARYLPGAQPVTVNEQSGAIVQLAQPVQAVSR